MSAKAPRKKIRWDLWMIVTVGVSIFYMLFLLYPLISMLSKSVIGEDGAVCDGLSTSLFVMGLEKAAALWAESSDFEAIFIAADGTVYITDGLKEDFSLLSDYADTTVQVITR